MIVQIGRSELLGRRALCDRLINLENSWNKIDMLGAALAGKNSNPDHLVTVDAVVVGAGFGGMFMVNRLRSAGLSVLGIEAGAMLAAFGTGTAIPGRVATYSASITVIRFPMKSSRNGHGRRNIRRSRKYWPMQISSPKSSNFTNFFGSTPVSKVPYSMMSVGFGA